MRQRAALNADEETVRAGVERHLTILSSVIGERNLFHPGALEGAARYIEDQLRSWGYQPLAQVYSVNGKQVRNIEVEVRGTRRPEQIVILGAHYDSVNCPAANDNGSGVAGVLEIARLLARQPFRRTVRFVFFVNEEPPFYKSKHMGSIVYAKRCRERGEQVVGMINLETIGCYSDEPGSQRYPHPFGRKWFRFLPRRGNFVAIVGNVRSWRFTWRVNRLFRRAVRFPSVWMPAPERIEGPGMSDHWSFWQEGYAAVMVTDTAYFRYDHYHKQSDTIDKLDLMRMARVVFGFSGVVTRLGAG